MADRAVARIAAGKTGELLFVEDMIYGYNLNYYLATGSQMTLSATPVQIIDAACTTPSFMSGMVYADEGDCRSQSQSMLDWDRYSS